MSRRASLPGADELFRRTSAERPSPARTQQPRREEPEPRPQGTKSTNLQVAPGGKQEAPAGKGPKHQEKVTFYCTSDDLMALESARLKLRAQHSIAADRGRIVRAALAYVLEDFEARGDDAVLLRKLGE